MERHNLTGWFTQNADIFYSKTSEDKRGGVKKEWIRKYFQTPCRVFGFSGNYTIAEQGIQYSVEKKMLCDIDIDVFKGDKVTVDDEQFIIIRTDKPQAREKHHTVCLLARLDE